MRESTLIKYCLFDDDAILTYPFKDEKYGKIPVLRHKRNEKWFALIFKQDGNLYVNLKCNPVEASMLRDLYPFVTPAWHMNKKHWNKVEVDKAPLPLLKNMIKASFNLTL